MRWLHWVRNKKDLGGYFLGRVFDHRKTSDRKTEVKHVHVLKLLTCILNEILLHRHH